MCDIILLLLQLIQRRMRRMRRMCLHHQSWTPGRRRFSGVISRLGGFKGHSCWFSFIHIYGQVGSYFFIMMAMTKTTIWNEDEKKVSWKDPGGPNLVNDEPEGRLWLRTTKIWTALYPGVHKKKLYPGGQRVREPFWWTWSSSWRPPARRWCSASSSRCENNPAGETKKKKTSSW